MVKDFSVLQLSQIISLQGKKVIVLGGSSGIGLAKAKAALKAGASVVIVSSNQGKINNALKDITRGSEGYAVNLSREENIKDLFSNAGKFDHLVYCAGENLTPNTIDATAIDQARDFFTLRFGGPFAAVKYGIHLLIKADHFH